MEDGRVWYPDQGTPQGGVVSPLLSNVFLHEVLDTWFHQCVRPRLRGRAFLVRYADDAVLGFEYEDDARRVLAVLPKRFGKYGLTLHPEKTESPQTRVGGNGRRSMAREPQNTPCSRPLLRPRDYARQAHAPTVPRASGVKTSTAWTPPSRRGRKAHNCSLSGRTAGVSPARAEAPAEDAPSALTRRSARSYLAPTPQPATARPSAAAADPPRF